MGADCTFAHSTSELRPSPKPCFDFVKTGFCLRGEGCRFVHEMKSNSKLVDVNVSPFPAIQAQAGPSSFVTTYMMPTYNFVNPMTLAEAQQLPPPYELEPYKHMANPHTGTDNNDLFGPRFHAPPVVEQIPVPFSLVGFGHKGDKSAEESNFPSLSKTSLSFSDALEHCFCTLNPKP